MKNILYILCDNTLDPIYAAVQGGHSVAEFLRLYEFDYWNNETIVYVSVDIEKWRKYLLYDEADYYAYWKEPDQNNRITAIAVLYKNQSEYIQNKLKKEDLLK